MSHCISFSRLRGGLEKQKIMWKECNKKDGGENDQKQIKKS